MVASTEGTDVARTLVVKIGSGVLLDDDLNFDRPCIRRIAKQIATVRNTGVRVVLVVSGAVAYGARHVQVHDDDSRRVAAVLGWLHIVEMFHHTFAKFKCSIAPTLLLADSKGGIHRRAQVGRFLDAALDHGLLPVINEYDALQLNGFGGNDLLAAHVAILASAKEVLTLSTPSGSPYGIGGSEAKHSAVLMLAQRGIQVRGVNGKTKTAIADNVW